MALDPHAPGVRAAADWEYAPAPESAAIGRVRDRYQMFTGGAFVDGRGDDLTTLNPATAQPLSVVSTASV